jgi:hypothetical protein
MKFINMMYAAIKSCGYWSFPLVGCLARSDHQDEYQQGLAPLRKAILMVQSGAIFSQQE